MSSGTTRPNDPPNLPASASETEPPACPAVPDEDNPDQSIRKEGYSLGMQIVGRWILRLAEKPEMRLQGRRGDKNRILADSLWERN
ncbi:hypothetical protein BV25DRAFT_1833459 [Artomyces pyxidatus]|uniref:Uncharacterized protein n=1 Tax=Artomyces pyxidatus TaxID=48021 RepID=A0ACB8SGB5_9AGAM|nr:hypothetical protein BV25DRAFT_1833459 [Artomyces pyxidatus]